MQRRRCLLRLTTPGPRHAPDVATGNRQFYDVAGPLGTSQIRGLRGHKCVRGFCLPAIHRLAWSCLRTQMLGCTQKTATLVSCSLLHLLCQGNHNNSARRAPAQAVNIMFLAAACSTEACWQSGGAQLPSLFMLMQATTPEAYGDAGLCMHHNSGKPFSHANGYNTMVG